MSQSLNYHELKDLYLDSLTNLSNRNKLKKDLKDSASELMALFDIDEFIATNDLFGEIIGDKILKEFASKMRNYFDGNEFLLYRIESDKFAVVPKNKMDNKRFFQYL